MYKHYFKLQRSNNLTLLSLQVNILAHFWTIKAFMPDMIKHQNGHIVNVASLAGHSGTNKLV